MDHDDITHLMQQKPFPDDVSSIQCKETHVSWVLLTGEVAYKIKKPVNFGFLDFSTLNQRLTACQNELRLNRRTAPDWYLDVVPVCRTQDGVNFLQKGEVVDYAVKMKQFEPDALLGEARIRATLPTDFYRKLGRELATYHRQFTVMTASQNEYSSYSVWQPVEENWMQLACGQYPESIQTQLNALEAWSKTQFEKLQERFEKRKQEGFVRECHGDLHMGNIAVVEGCPIFFDGIEFNAALRWIDTANDLAFLIMDLEFHGLSPFATVVLNHYLDYSGDYGALQVLRYFMVYRAMVRAKVTYLRGQQSGEENPDTLYRYVHYAVNIMQKKQRFLAITVGVSGSGKSHFASSLCASAEAIQLRSDIVRKQLVGLLPLEKSSTLKTGKGIYSASFHEKTYTRLFELTQQALAAGFSVVVDATFLKQADRAVFMNLAEAEMVSFLICHLWANEDTLISRILTRQKQDQDASEASVAIMHSQLKYQEAFTEAEMAFVRSDSDNQALLSRVWEYIERCE